ncbi:hypothetical protein BASA60_003951 [Batrachochytrium salamandrivorans]|nr:hypothetical protein BASA60_003951 [Batrachochytrium salamandrivorans]
MKFNVFVVAAMVITSVNAGGSDKPSSGDENSGGRSKSVVPEGLMGDSSGSESLQESLGHGSEPALTQDSLQKEWNESQYSEPTEYDPKCDPIVIKLDELWLKADEINARFYSQLPVYYRLMKGEDLRGKKIKKHKLKLKKMTTYLKLSDENKTKLTELKARYTGVMNEYRVTWKKLRREGCPTEHLRVFSVKDMIQKGHFLQW